MTWAVFLNNQTVLQANISPNGQWGGITRYIFIEGRSVPITLTDEGASSVPQNWAVGVEDGTNPHYQLGYEGGGNIQITLEQVDGSIKYTASSGFTTVTKTL